MVDREHSTNIYKSLKIITGAGMKNPEKLKLKNTFCNKICS